MKIKNIITQILILSSIFLPGCISATGADINFSNKEGVDASGNIVSRNIKISSTINSISLPSIIDVVVTQGNKESITLKGSDNLVNYCQCSVKNGALVVNLTKEGESKRFRKFDVKVYATVKDLNKVSISGTGDITFDSPFSTKALSLSISGTGDIDIPSLKCTDLEASVSGTGDIDINATCTNATLNIYGTGDIDAEFSSLQKLSASISGTGDISLSGSAEKATYMVAGTGDIEAKKLRANYVEATSVGTGDIECYAVKSFIGTKNTTGGLKCYGDPAVYKMTKN